MMHLASHALLNLMLAFLCYGAVCYLQVKKFLKELCNRVRHLVAKTSTALDVLCLVLRVEGHIKPLEL